MLEVERNTKKLYKLTGESERDRGRVLSRSLARVGGLAK